MIIATGQISKVRGMEGVLDITVKSGDPVFAPTWDMVMGWKQGWMSQDEYVRRYTEMMRESYRRNKDRWLEVLKHDVILTCYCRAGDFCHRYLLRDMLVKVAIANGIEAIAKGEIVNPSTP